MERRENKNELEGEAVVTVSLAQLIDVRQRNLRYRERE